MSKRTRSLVEGSDLFFGWQCAELTSKMTPKILDGVSAWTSASDNEEDASNIVVDISSTLMAALGDGGNGGFALGLDTQSAYSQPQGIDSRGLSEHYADYCDGGLHLDWLNLLLSSISGS